MAEHKPGHEAPSEVFKKEGEKTLLQAGLGFLGGALVEVISTGLSIVGLGHFVPPIRRIFNRESGHPAPVHHDHHAPAPAGEQPSLHVEPEGQGYGDEQGIMEDFLFLRDRGLISETKYDETVKWLKGKKPKFRERFRRGYYKQSDEAKRLRFLVRFANLPNDTARTALAEAAGHVEPHDHWHKVKEVWEKYQDKAPQVIDTALDAALRHELKQQTNNPRLDPNRINSGGRINRFAGRLDRYFGMR